MRDDYTNDSEFKNHLRLIQDFKHWYVIRHSDANNNWQMIPNGNKIYNEYKIFATMWKWKTPDSAPTECGGYKNFLVWLKL